MHPLDDPRIDRNLLSRYGFDEARFRDAIDRVMRKELFVGSSVITESIAPLSDVVDVFGVSSEEAKEAGNEALAAGRVAAIVLNGGMATRFGNVVKGTVEVYDGRSFIELKAEDVRRASEVYGKQIPLVLMNSFATEEATASFVEARSVLGLADGQLLMFNQSISVRLDPSGGLFIGEDGGPSYYAPGHGDFFSCIRKSGVLKDLRDRGIEVLLFSNIDNLGATIDPVIVGRHLLSGCDMSVEVTEKRQTASGAWDKGGAPAIIGGRPQLVEAFRFPEDFDQHLLPDFSTNNFTFSSQAIDRPIELELHAVKKTVDGKDAIQLESITCEASALTDDDGAPLLPMQALRVPRDGPSGRFYPVKERADLAAMKDIIRERLEEGWERRSSAV